MLSKLLDTIAGVLAGAGFLVFVLLPSLHTGNWYGLVSFILAIFFALIATATLRLMVLMNSISTDKWEKYRVADKLLRKYKTNRLSKQEWREFKKLKKSGFIELTGWRSLPDGSMTVCYKIVGPLK